jgi:hypothetical protein
VRLLDSPYLVSVDPGNDGCGVALWSVSGELLRAGYAAPRRRLPEPAARWMEVAHAVIGYAGVLNPEDVAIEVPQVYPDDPVPPNDLITLAMVAGVVLGHLSPLRATRYLPREWKGQVPKKVQHERLRAHLKSAELGRLDLPAPSLQHNVWDAIGIGMHHLTVTRRRVK